MERLRHLQAMEVCTGDGLDGRMSAGSGHDYRTAANAEAWLRFNGRANNASDTGATSSRIRATLDLPPPGEGC